MKEKPVSDVVNELKSQAWNEAIAPRAEALLSYLRADLYQKGFLNYYKSVEKLGERKLLTGCKTEREDNFMRGYLVAIKELLAFPEQIESFVEAKKSPPVGPSAYTESA